MVEEAGATQGNSVVKIDNQQIAVVFDNPHLLKNAKNMLMKHNVVFNGKIASFNHIRNLYHVDCVSTPRLVPKLKEKFVNPTPFLAMNVCQATRTLSNSVAKGLEYYVQTHELQDSALDTAAFVEFHDMLFDVFNSRSSSSSKKPYRGPITAESCHWSFLEVAEGILKSMYYTSNTCFDTRKAKKESKTLTTKQRKPNYLRGFIDNINSIRWLWKTLCEEFGSTELCTNYLCQDCVENLFGEIRSCFQVCGNISLRK
ncbi:uncharacterized protein LOC134221578 [Armigeres subalbatus]|uniref:uncharacterized protein LOC134221578 n=1 Tax=Armigeres subalbatus TaxID=124917 RepID=UPI002ED16C79